MLRAQPDLSERRDVAEDARARLVVIATNAEVETLGLRLLMREKAIVLKPVHRIALQEALAVANGDRDAADSVVLAVAGSPLLRGHVLLVEDEPVNAAVAEGYLTALGCTSVWVRNGRDVRRSIDAIRSAVKNAEEPFEALEGLRRPR